MDRIFSKPGLLFIVQIDHISGEIMGSAIDYLYEAGAYDVQVLNTVTKKSRPGHVFFIDAKPEEGDQIEAIIRRELNTTGWHRIDTERRYVPVQVICRSFKVEMDPTYFTFDAEGKMIDNDPLSIRPNHRSCVNLRSEIEARFGYTLALGQVKALLTKAFLNPDDNQIVIRKES